MNDIMNQKDFADASNLIVGNAIANIVRHSPYSMAQVMNVIANIAKYGNPYHLSGKDVQIYQVLKAQIDQIVSNM